MKRIPASILVSLFLSIILLMSGCGSSSSTNDSTDRQIEPLPGVLSSHFVASDYIAASQQGSLSEKVVLIDTRSATEYAAGHIAGAINVDHSEYIRTRTENGIEVKYLVLNDEEFIAFVNRFGITPDTTVIAYDNDISFGWAPRLAWTLQYYGHSRAFSLDGGIQKWQLIDGRPLVTTPTLPTANSTPYVITGKRDILATKAEVSAKLEDSSVVFLDTRAPGEFVGTTLLDTYRPGHLPGAVFIDWSDFLKDNPQGITYTDANGVKRPVKILKSETELRELLTAKRITPDKTIIPYCEGGIRSSFVTQILLGLGYANVRNYDGSWNEWGKQTDTTLYPVELHDGRTDLLTANATLDNYFVDTEYLADNLGSVKIVDVRSAADYAAGHIEGAVNADNTTFVYTRADGVKYILLPEAEFVALANNLGITDNDTVIVYAQDNNSYAARLAWSFHYYGHNQAYAVNGGISKWLNENRPVTTTATVPTPTAAFTVTSHADNLALVEEVQQGIDNPGVVLFDTRTVEEFNGTRLLDTYTPGHLPGAVWINWTDLQTYDSVGARVLKSRDELLAQLIAAGITPDKTIIPYCEGGIRSSYVTNVLKGLGYPTVRNYDGSWNEWGKFAQNDPTNYPVE